MSELKEKLKKNLTASKLAILLASLSYRQASPANS
jgi:hypothetical protein